MHKTNQELVDIINLHTDNSLGYDAHCIPLYKHGELVTITAVEPLNATTCSIHMWTRDVRRNWLTRAFIRDMYDYVFEHYTTAVARIDKNNAPAIRAAINTGYTLCYSTEQQVCYTFTREQYIKRFSSLLETPT